ncbi:MAG: O-antigen ligase family protein [Pseudomonadota bacterium]
MTTSLPSIARNNEAYFSLAVAGVGLIGSVLTVSLVVIGVWAVTSLWRDRYQYILPSGANALALSCAAFAVIGLALTFYHANTNADRLVGIGYVLFLMPMVLFARYDGGERPVEFALILRWALPAAGLFGVAIGIVQYVFVGIRAEGGAGNALPFATVMAMAAPGALMLACRDDRIWVRLYSASGWLGCLFAVFLSESRTMIAVLFMATLLFAVWNWRPLVRGLPRAVIIASLIAAGFLATAGAIFVVERTVSQVEEDRVPEARPSSVGWRVLYWKAGWDIALEKPLLGVGRDARMAEVGKVLVADGNRENPDLPHSHLHNAYLNALVDHGLPGIVSLLAVLVLPVVIWFRDSGASADGALTAGYVGMVLTVALSGMTNVHFENDVIASYFLTLSIGFWLARMDRTPTARAIGQSVATD